VVELDGDVSVEFPKNKDKLLGTAMPQHDFPKDFHIYYIYFSWLPAAGINFLCG